MDFHHVKNDFQASTPKNYKSKSKGVSPTKARRASNGHNPSDSQIYSSNMSSPSRFNLPVSAFENDSIRVYVRVRPLDSKEMVSSNPKDRVNIIKVDESTLHVLNPYIGSEWSNKPEKTYLFNRVFDTEVQTAKLYEDTLATTVENIINGYNSTILAYGMTGAGKTFTMFGDIANVKGGPTVHPGIVSLVVNDLFAAFNRELEKGFEFNIKFSYLEIYNEHVRDLLTPSTEDLMIIEDAEKGIAIPNLSESQINSLEDVLKLIVLGNSRRVMASTHANQFSSRSHAIIQLLIEKRTRTRNITEPVVQSKLCLVDLAGSERAAVSENKGLRHREGANINRSLLALGNCINILSDPNKRGAFVPYRDSKLTRLLKESLGGNTQTVMVACVSPSHLAYEETVNTLKYALRARNIQKKVMPNVQEVELHVSEYKEIIHGLTAEVNYLKQKLGESKFYRVIQVDNVLLDNEQTGQIGVVQQKMTADYINKVNVMLDELGRKLISVFQEHWETIQANEELQSLKAHNEEMLRSKVQQLGKAVGDSQLYSKITNEISALKEVMVNNEKIQKEIEVNIERTEEEKRMVQHQILGTIAQTCQNSETVQREICLEEIARGSPLLNMESPTLKKIMHVQEEDTFESAEKEIKMQELMDEVEEMKRQLAEKDKLLIQNQKIIQFFLQSGTKIPNFRSASTKKLIPNASPSKEKGSHDIDRDSTKWVELSHQEQDLKAADATNMINRVPTTAQMPSMSKVKNHHRVLSPRSLERISALLFGRTNSSVSLSKGPDTSRTGGADQNYHPVTKIVERTVDNHLSQRSGTSSIEEFNYLSYMNNTNFEDKGYHSRRSSNFSQKMTENIPTTGLQVSTARIVDQPNVVKTSASATYRHHQKSLSNSIPYSQEANTTIDTLKPSKSPTNKFGPAPNLMRRNTGESIPSSSSSTVAFHARENSHEFSFKDSFTENYNNIGRQVKTSSKPKSSQNDNKENLQKKATSPKSSFSTTVAYSSRISSQKSPTSNTKQNSTIKSKFYDVSTPDVSNSKIIEPVRNMTSPTAALSKAKSPIRASSPPDKLIAPKSPNQIGFGSPVMNNSKQQQSRLKTGLRVEINIDTNPLGESMRENLTDKKILNESVLTPTLQSNRNTGQKSEFAREKKSPVGIFSNESSQSKSEIKNLDTRRDASKGFRTKLHQLANSVSSNSRLTNTSLREISSLLDEYRLNVQAYPLTTGDSTAFKKLELALTNPFNQQNFLGEITEHDSGSDTMRTKEMSEVPQDTDPGTNITPYESLKKYERNPNMTFARNSKVIGRASSVDENNLYTDQTSKTGLERLDEPQMSTQNESTLGISVGGPFTCRAKDMGNADGNNKVRSQISKNFKLIRDARKR